MASSFMLKQASNPILQGIEGESSSSAWDQVCHRFSFDEIRTATRNFDEGLVVGKGGFGKVYEATLENGGVAAIKRLDYSRSTQGEPQFVAEIETLSKLRHCHLVSLIGYCNDGQEMILVYEFMPNGTLEQHRSRLSWSQRLKICLGAARGLDYLHTGTGTKHGVIHRDVKSSNILLDHNWDAKISDFGLSKIGPTNQTNSFVKTDIKGTFGYIDPCYFTSARLTRKSDVYSFGVVLFELLCGRAAVDKTLDEEQWGLAGWIQKCMRAGKLAQIVDSNIRDQISPKSLKGFVGIAARCLYNNPDKRPTMAEVVVKLAKIVSSQERTNSPLTKWTLKEKMFSLFPNRAPVISSPVAISDEERSLQPTDIHFDPDDDPSIESLQVDFETIRVATDNFSKANRVQQHSSSYVYKGRLQNGQGIAVEKFGIYSLQFRDDILSLMLKLRHSNVVRLLGYCVDQESNTLFLIYNFFPYASLDWLIYDHVKRACLDWHKLGNIIIRVAQGLHYIHEGWVLLRDFTPNKILLDESLEPKISGFESAWCLPKDKAHIDLRDEPQPTSLLNRGYHAPEEEDYRLSLKSNVYSFGSLLLEIIDCSRRLESYNISSTSLYDLLHAWIDWQGRNSKRLTDPAYKGDLSFVMRFIQIGLLCIQPDENDRPTMGSVVLMLTDSSVDLPIPKKPL